MELPLLMVLDIVAFVIVLALSQWIYYSHVSIQVGGVPYIMSFLVIILLVNSVCDLYSLETNHILPLNSHWMLTPFAALISFLVMISLIYFLGVERFVGSYFGRGILTGTMVGFAIVSTAYRFVLHGLFTKFKMRQHYLVLANDKTLEVIKEENARYFRKNNLRPVCLKDFEDPVCDLSGCAGIVIDDEMLKDDRVVKRLMLMRLRGVHVFSAHDFFETVWLKVPVSHLKDNWFAMERGFVLLHNPVALKVKRILDILYSIALLACALPLFPLIALSIKLTSKGPIIYSQIRTGENGKNFVLYKFRSMIREAETGVPQWAQRNDLRITPVGKVLRYLRLDELPQVWNVIRGDMSFIGPRPERPEFNKKLEKLIPYYNLRHLVKPGITGWAQVLYPYGASVEDTVEKLQYELYYIKNYSLLLDFGIMIKTIRTVLLGKGR